LRSGRARRTLTTLDRWNWTLDRHDPAWNSREQSATLKFLIADDSPGNLKLLRTGLEYEGHQVIEASNGIEALAALEREPVDALISDILMPSMDGFRLCREIRTSSKSYSEIPLVLYTATYDSPTDRALAEAVGADAYILKPASPATLIAAVRDALQSAKPSRIAGANAGTSTGAHTGAHIGDDANILALYNAALVHKLESRNSEVQESLAQLQRAHATIIELNRLLETRVEQRTAALEAANKELEAYSFSVSHDLQVPLRQISGLVQQMKASGTSRLDDENRGLLAHVAEATAQMSQLIEALLAFARTTRSEMHFVEVDLNPLIDKVIAGLSLDLRGRIVEWRRSALPRVHGDPILLQQVLANLLSNAVKYTRPRDQAVIEIGAREGRGNEAVIFVRDNGVGFDSRYADKLFGVFQRMHAADEFEGTGVGLANARRIITRHGGTIWADAATGNGASFYFTLPRS
jgi:signal transduction histidine kinase